MPPPEPTADSDHPAPPVGAHDTPPVLAARLARELGDATRGRLRVLDPAAGSGALLVAAWRELGPPGRLAPEDLVGVERDPGRVADARRRLVDELGPEVGGRVAANLVAGDALAPGTAWPAGTHVLANPPWASLSGRQALAVDASERVRLAHDYDALAGWPSLHGAFLERIARHVGEHGTSARVLVPASVAELEGYAATRAAVARHARVDGSPEALGEDAFPGVVEPALLVTLVPGAGEDAWSPAHVERDPLVDALERFPRLAPECFRDPGVHSGNAARELVVRGDEAHAFPGLREGKDLRAFELAPPRLGLRTDLVPTSERRFRVAPLERYRAVPVLVRQTADRPIAALHVEPTYFRNSLLACTPPPGLAPEVVVAVLNSDLLARYHRARFVDARQRTFPQVKIRHLRALPFPFEGRADAPRLHDALAAARGEELERLVAEGFGLGKEFRPRE